MIVEDTTIVREELRNFIAENLLYSSNGFPYDDDASFLVSGIIDSMNVMEIVMFVERVFEIPIEDHEITPDNFDSIENIAHFVLGKGDMRN